MSKSERQKKVRSASNVNATKRQQQPFQPFLPPFPLYKNLEKKSFQEGLESVADILNHCKNILVLAGAGLSVSCGIPDFRSKDTGLYSTLDTQVLGLVCAEDLFDLETFKDNPQPFYKFAKSLYPGSIIPSSSHYFISLLERKNKLLRLYTQNIDGLEHIAGISKSKIVYAHGSLNWFYCMKCKTKFDPSIIQQDVLEGKVPFCQKMTKQKSSAKKQKTHKSCIQSQPLRRKGSRFRKAPISMHVQDCSEVKSDQFKNDIHQTQPKREIDDIDDGSISSTCGGIIKPGITFFGEKLDDKVGKSLNSDKSKVDAVIVIGTSLSVAPMSKVIDYLPSSIPRILINKNHLKQFAQTQTKVKHESNDIMEDIRHNYYFDANLLGNCDDVTSSLVTQLGWNAEFNQVIESSNIDNKKSSLVSQNEIEGIAMDRTLCFRRQGDNENTDYETPNESENSNNQSSSLDEIKTEVVICDGCSKSIQPGHTIMTCSDCFDYDLCAHCFKTKSKNHFKGKHTFQKDLC